MDSHSHQSSRWSKSRSRPPDRLEQLVTECLDRSRVEGETVIEVICGANPEHADAIRRRVVMLRQLGLLGEFDSVPSRLGGFRLLRRLGIGGMGVVYLAEQESLRRQVALKVIRPEQLDLPGARERFLREVETVAQLKHPGIIPIYTVGDEQGLPFFAMEYVEGCSLAEVILQLQDRTASTLRGEDLSRLLGHRDGTDHSSLRLSGSWVEVCFRLIQQVAVALEHAHQRGILHRDIKPSNIMLTPDGRVLLLDFGLASSQSTSKVTRTGSQVGSLPYMPPERLSDAPVDGRADVYSLGVTLYELLTLKLPFSATTTVKTIQLILRGTPDRIAQHNAAVPWDADTVCLTAMEPDPKRRYAGAADFARDLANVLELRPILARRPGLGLRLRRSAQRHPARAVGLLAAFVILVVGPIAFGIQQRIASAKLRLANAEISRHAALVAQRADDLMRLADVKDLQDLKNQAERLWPRRPEMIDAYRAWLEQANRLRDHLPQHVAMLETLASRATGNNRDGELEFASSGDAWWHAALSSLVKDLRSFIDPKNGLISAIEQRLEIATTIVAATLTEPADDWAFARQHVAESSLYAALDLEPQLGLIPLEPDPQSGLFEFWLWESGARPERDDKTGRYHITGDTGMVFILLPGGTFMMGAQSNTRSSTYDAEAQPPEGPPHLVSLAAFFLSKYEVTQGQWLRLMGSNRWWNRNDYGAIDPVDPLAHPAVLVKYSDCVEAVTRLGLLLPTESQWEYGARGGTTGPRWVGADKSKLQDTDNLADQKHLMLGGNSTAFVHELWDDGFWTHAPVGSYVANPFGLHDVLGNVWEWCRDWYGSYQLPVAPGDGERIVTDSKRRVVRGGCWEFCAAYARSSWRMDQDLDFSFDAIGFRPSRVIEVSPPAR